MRADFALLLLEALKAPRRSFSDRTIGPLHARKDAYEIAKLRAAAPANDAAVKEAVAGLDTGMTERDVAGLIQEGYCAAGAQTDFTIVAFGENGAFPHPHTGPTVLALGMGI
ncbi:MAG: M24 family metallopeptidase [Pseudomonadota bacterium]